MAKDPNRFTKRFAFLYKKRKQLEEKLRYEDRNMQSKSSVKIKRDIGRVKVAYEHTENLMAFDGYDEGAC